MKFTNLLVSILNLLFKMIFTVPFCFSQSDISCQFTYVCQGGTLEVSRKQFHLYLVFQFSKSHVKIQLHLLVPFYQNYIKFGTLLPLCFEAK